MGFPGGSDSVCLQCRRPEFNPWVGKIPWRRKWQPTPVPLLGKFHGLRSLVGYSPWDHKELDMTDFTFTFYSFKISDWFQVFWNTHSANDFADPMSI